MIISLLGHKIVTMINQNIYHHFFFYFYLLFGNLAISCRNNDVDLATIWSIHSCISSAFYIVKAKPCRIDLSQCVHKELCLSRCSRTYWSSISWAETVSFITLTMFGRSFTSATRYCSPFLTIIRCRSFNVDRHLHLTGVRFW